MTVKRIPFVLIMLLRIVLLYGGEYSVSSKILWNSGKFVIDIGYPLESTERALPAVKKQVELKVSENLGRIIFTELSPVIIDSHTTVKSFLHDSPSSAEKIYGLADKARLEYSLFSKDMRSVNIRYTLKLYPDIAGIFFSHKEHRSIDKLLYFVPSADFSGIVIYVENPAVLFGKGRKGSFSPSLFPKIYDEKMNLIMDKTNVDPESILKWGVTGYRNDFDLTKETSRIGYNPVKITARGLFGINNTDIIIPDREASKILSKDHNIDLIYKGRILIIYPGEPE